METRSLKRLSGLFSGSLWPSPLPLRLLHQSRLVRHQLKMKNSKLARGFTKWLLAKAVNKQISQVCVVRAALCCTFSEFPGSLTHLLSLTWRNDWCCPKGNELSGFLIASVEVTQIVSGWWLFSQKWYFLAVCFAASCSWCVAAVTAFWWRSVLSSLQLTGDLQRFLQETASCFQKSVLCLLFLKETFSGCETVEPGLLLLHDIVHLCNEWSVLVTVPMLMGFYMQNANLTAYFSLCHCGYGQTSTL